ncbi:MAG: T9SS type A sorting domain-containing protein [Ignavibacteria bacterium]|nr:T9SS type A sorting domain-containing protein [Ignavibacteria bacterium]
MKKILLTILFAVILTGITESQVKVNVFLTNPGLSSGRWKIDVMATVPAGQNWRVGSSNLRIDFTTTPSGAATISSDNPVINPNSNLHSNANYSAMTTTSILGGTAISLNITRLNNCYNLTPGTYKLGEIRFNRVDTTGCITLTFRTNSVFQDSITQMNNPADWTFTNPGSCIRLDYLTGTEGNGSEIPTVFKLYNNYPNPFNPSTSIKYDVPRNTFVNLSIYDILGRLVTNLVSQDMTAGRYDVTWDAKNYASGTYIYKLEAGDFSDVKKMILVK